MARLSICGRLRPLRFMAAILLAAAAPGCYDPSVREKLLLTLERDGRCVLSVDTTFKKGEGLKPEEEERIQRVLDLYHLGRDPWLKGLARADARDVVHELNGEKENPQGISRTGTIPGAESLVEVMPDAIANFRLLADPETGALTMRIVHIDTPESLRDNRRRLEREIETFAGLGFELSEKTCDLYDYLAGHADRRGDVLQALGDERKIAGMLTPEETALTRELAGAFERSAGFGQVEGKGEAPILASLSFSAFEHDFCVRIPVEASEALGLAREPAGKNEAEGATYCVPRLTLGDLGDTVWPESNPPLIDADLPSDEEALLAAPFTCLRYADAAELERKLWDRILPLPYYELTWSPATAVGGRTEHAQ